MVQGINVRTKHQRQVQSQGRTVNPGKVRFEAPVSISNVMVVCKKCNKPTRVELLREDDKTKRICKECKVDHRRLGRWESDLMNILKERYQKEISPALMKSLGLTECNGSPPHQKSGDQYWAWRGIG